MKTIQFPAKPQPPEGVPSEREALRQFVEARKTQKQAALDLGISQQYLNDLVHGRREMSESVGRKLGYQRCVIWMPLPASE